MQLTWISLVPPLIVIGATCVTRKLNISLVIGIVCAALIATHGNVVAAATLCLQRFVAHFFDRDSLYLYSFLIMISSLITLLTLTGSAACCARIIGKKMSTKRSVEMSAIILSFVLSIDDYLSILTTGFVMQPLADRLAVARSKLAYIVHSLAGPLVIIMPLSTWAAAVMAQLDGAGVHLSMPNKIVADPFYVYLKTIPFIFYSLLLVMSVVCVVLLRISYGEIAHDEHVAIVIDDTDNVPADHKRDGSLFELLAPMTMLIGGVFFGLLYTGNYYIFGGDNSFIGAFINNDKTLLVLLFAGLSAFCCSVMISLYKKTVLVTQVPIIVYEGARLMQSSIIMVALASILGSFLRLDLHTGSYLASLLMGTIPLHLLPLLLFIVSLVITLTIGSAWGTFSILIPIMTQMLISFLHLEVPVDLDQISILFPALGAVLSGAACGNHISPFAETTIMTATSTGMEPMRHARTQFEYAIPVVIGTLVAFGVVGFLYDSGLWRSFFVSLSAGISTMMLIFALCALTKKQG